MAKKNDLIGLAKSSKKTTKATKKPAAKKATKEPVVKELTPEELRDQKAKAKVEELLKDSPITTLDKKEELIELDEPTNDEPKGVEWLEEQVTLLSEKNAGLTAEMKVVKADFEKILLENQQLKAGGSVPNTNDENVKKVVIQLFNELQENHIKLGVDKNGIGNFRIYCPGFLNRMIKFFPFLEEVKRYQ